MAVTLEILLSEPATWPTQGPDNGLLGLPVV